MAQKPRPNANAGPPLAQQQLVLDDPNEVLLKVSIEPFSVRLVRFNSWSQGQGLSFMSAV